MKVLFIAGWAGDTQRYRAWHQAEQLWFADIPAAVRLADDPMLIADLLDYDTFIFCRASYSPLIAAALAWIQDRGLLSIYDTDDLIFRPELASHVDLLYNMPPADTALHLRQFAANRATLEQCDFVITSTPYLAQQVNEHTNRQAFVNRNSLNDDQLSYSTEAYNQRQQRLAARKESDPIVISYLSGSPSHSRDFAICAPALARIMAAHQEVTLLLGGYLSLADTDLFQYEGTHRISRAPFVPWRALPAVQAQADINLAPLELTNPFALGKSELKYFEAAACAVPTIASPTPSFQEAIRNGENGLLAATDAEWEAALRQLLDPAARERIGQSARADVYSRYTPEVRATEFAPLLANLWQRKQAAATPQPQRGDNLAWLEAEAIARLHRFATEQARLTDSQLIAEYLPDYPQPQTEGQNVGAQFIAPKGEENLDIAQLQTHIAALESQLAASERQRKEQADLLRRISNGRVMRLMNWLTRKNHRLDSLPPQVGTFGIGLPFTSYQLAEEENENQAIVSYCPCCRRHGSFGV